MGFNNGYDSGWDDCEAVMKKKIDEAYAAGVASCTSQGNQQSTPPPEQTSYYPTYIITIDYTTPVYYGEDYPFTVTVTPNLSGLEAVFTVKDGESMPIGYDIIIFSPLGGVFSVTESSDSVFPTTVETSENSGLPYIYAHKISKRP